MASQIGRVGWQKRFVGVLGVVLSGILVAALCITPAEAKFTVKDKVKDDEIKLQIYGFSQLEMRGGTGYTLGLNDGLNSPLDIEFKKNKSVTADDGPFFSSQRIRMGFNYFNGKVAGKLFLDFNQPHERSFTIDAGMPRMIKDAFVAYRWNNAASIRLGMIKTPLGLDFTIPGWNLDIIQRGGLEKALVLERQAGITLSGRLIGQDGFGGDMKTNGLEMGNERQGKGFGYDIGVYNPTQRSASVNSNVNTVIGDGLAYVGRVHWDWGKPLHVEAAYGVSEYAGGVDRTTDPANPVFSEDYTVTDFGVASELFDAKLELKGEYIMGQDMRGIKGYNQSTIALTAGWLFADWCQFVVKTYQSEVEFEEDPAVPKSELGNTYVGFNFYFQRLGSSHRDLQRNKIVVNYIIVNGDDMPHAENDLPPTSEGTWYGIGGFSDSAWAVQWQYKF
jgi:hypothetical protein